MLDEQGRGVAGAVVFAAPTGAAESFGTANTATDVNGTTNEDRTNYLQNVPTSGLDSVLWLESDRMGHLLP